MERILGVRFGTTYDPADQWRTWMWHWSGVARRELGALTFAQILDMYEFMKTNTSGGG